MKWALLACWGIMTACTLPLSRGGGDTSPEYATYSRLESQIKSQNFETAVKTAEEFQVDFPYSLRLQKVRFLKANALEELGRWNEAAATYSAISVFSEKNQPEISALAVYRLSFVYEALGDDQRVITTLFEAAKYHQYLPLEVINAAIPSRLAMIYAKENNPQEAKKWIAEAEKGLQRTLSTHQEPLSDSWLAELYFNMGSVSTAQLSGDNILTVIQGQQAVQKYLIRSLQYQDPTWSAKALKKLKTTFLDLWKAIEQYPEPGGYEPLVAQKMKRDEQVRLAGPFTDLVREAELFRPGVEQKTNTYQQEFFGFLEEIQIRARTVLEAPLLTPLMPRADNPPQKPKSPVKIMPTEDPNL